MLIKDCGSKMNFIDENDNFVGFDFIGDCCEDFGYSISKSESLDYDSVDDTKDENCEGFYFDVSTDPVDDNISSGNDYGELHTVTFKLINDSGESLYLHLYNCHNGYSVMVGNHHGDVKAIFNKERGAMPLNFYYQ